MVLIWPKFWFNEIFSPLISVLTAVKRAPAGLGEIKGILKRVGVSLVSVFIIGWSVETVSASFDCKILNFIAKNEFLPEIHLSLSDADKLNSIPPLIEPKVTRQTTAERTRQ